MSAIDEIFEQKLQRDFLQTIHNEKIKTQTERATYTTSKLAFIIGLFGLGSLKIGTVDSYWLLYLIPLVAIGYDLYICAADLSIKKIGAFLRSNELTSKCEKDWEKFSAEKRGKIAPFANTHFTFIVTVAAAIYIYMEQIKTGVFYIGFLLWFTTFLIIILLMWLIHKKFVKELDKHQNFKDSKSDQDGSSGNKNNIEGCK